MDDLDKQAPRLAAELDVSWSDARVDDALDRLHGRRRRRTVAARAAVTLVAVALAAGAFLRLGHEPTRRELALPGGAPPLPAPRLAAPVAPSGPPALAANLTLGDGSTVQSLDRDTVVETGEVSPSAVTLRLRSGSARFRVQHRPSRVFRVVAGDVAIVDVGTEFTVTRQGASATVEVTEGQVRVEWEGGVAQLVAGERRLFPAARGTGERVRATRAAIVARGGAGRRRAGQR